MDIERWWPRLSLGTREWLAANNGDVVPASIVNEIVETSGAPTAGAWWVGESEAGGVTLSDVAIDWIEEEANGEHETARDNARRSIT